MIKYFLLFLAFTIAAIILLTSIIIPLFYFDYKACDDYTRISGLKNQWNVYNGCMVEYEGVWIDRKNVNIYKLKGEIK